MKPYTLGIYEKAMPAELSWKEKMETAKAAGYDFIEISIDETEEKLKRLDMGKQERLELVRLMYETGMPIRTMPEWTSEISVGKQPAGSFRSWYGDYGEST